MGWLNDVAPNVGLACFVDAENEEKVVPIEFNCSQCQSQLRVKEEHAGKSARCPSCQAINTIPAASVAPTAPTDDGGVFGDLVESSQPASDNPFAGSMSAAAGPNADKLNPYRPPAATKQPADATSGGPITPTAVGFEEIWIPAWQCWKANMGLMVACVATVFGVQLVFGIISNIAVAVFSQMGSEVALALGLLLIYVFGMAAQIFVNLGFNKICLKLLRRQQTGYGELFSAGDVLLPALGATMLFSLMHGLGFVLLIIPGIIIGLLFWTYQYLILEKRTGAIESFSVAYKLGRSNMLTGFVLFVVAIGLAILGLLMCYVGILFTAGLIQMLCAAAYLKMSGQLR